MSSLWTPDGERRVAREPAGEAPGSASGGLEPDADEAELAREMAELEQQLVAAPVEDVVANHCYGLFQLAALHLSRRPPNLDAARLAIDALGAVVSGLGARLGAQAEALSEGLAQIRLAYVQLSEAAAAGEPGGAASAP